MNLQASDVTFSSADMRDGSASGIQRYADGPFAFVAHYMRRRAVAHAAILGAVLGAVAFSTGTQYGLKLLVDTLASSNFADTVWLAFLALIALIAADHALWQLAGWIASSTFVGVTGDLRRDLFRYLTGHSPAYFSERLPGMLTSRITAASNAVFTVQNLFVWNVLPPCVATVAAIALVMTVSVPMALALACAGGLVVLILFRLAAAGKPLHHDFAGKAAAVDGEMIDVVGNMPLVRAFGGLIREHRRFDATVQNELGSRRSSLRYLEKLRIMHAVVTLILTVALLSWAIVLWQHGAATVGDVILICTLGLTVLSATRDLAIALVDATQHVARLSEALATLLVPHGLCDRQGAKPLTRSGQIVFDNVGFHYPDGRSIFRDFSLAIRPGERVGLVGRSGAGKSTLFALLQRFHDVESGRILVGDQDIACVTQESLRALIAVVPQDTSLLHRSIGDNIRYGRPDASEAEALEAAHAARCDFIDALPDGMATIVGDRGVKLSGGQRQRIAIARAFLKDAPILLLDEATSALDTELEEAIRDALARLMRGRTVIAIAHRLSTVRNFDRIVILQAGRVVEDGPPDLLMHRAGPYRELMHREITRLAQRAA